MHSQYSAQPKSHNTAASLPHTPAWLGVVLEKVGSLHYGVVQIVVHDSRVTLIERTERTRLDDRAVART